MHMYVDAYGRVQYGQFMRSSNSFHDGISSIFVPPLCLIAIGLIRVRRIQWWNRHLRRVDICRDNIGLAIVDALARGCIRWYMVDFPCDGWKGSISSKFIPTLRFSVSRLIGPWGIEWCNRHLCTVDICWDSDQHLVQNSWVDVIRALRVHPAFSERFHFHAAILPFSFPLLAFQRVDSWNYGESNGTIAIVLQWILVEIRDNITDGRCVCRWYGTPVGE